MMSYPSFHHAAWIAKVPTKCPTQSQSCPQGSGGLNSEYTEMLPTSVQPLQSSASSQLQKLKPNQIKRCCLRAWLTRVLECMDQHDNERCLKSIQMKMMRISRGKWRRSEDLQPNLPGRSLAGFEWPAKVWSLPITHPTWPFEKQFHESTLLRGFLALVSHSPLGLSKSFGLNEKGLILE